MVCFVVLEKVFCGYQMILSWYRHRPFMNLSQFHFIHLSLYWLFLCFCCFSVNLNNNCMGWSWCCNLIIRRNTSLTTEMIAMSSCAWRTWSGLYRVTTWVNTWTQYSTHYRPRALSVGLPCHSSTCISSMLSNSVTVYSVTMFSNSMFSYRVFINNCCKQFQTILFSYCDFCSETSFMSISLPSLDFLGFVVCPVFAFDSCLMVCFVS